MAVGVLVGAGVGVARMEQDAMKVKIKQMAISKDTVFFIFPPEFFDVNKFYNN
ncbi:hypothetical protein SDC9_183578 [bioreactor metagenome]|uniref:Uncharacterized protein n=1 Tax=bioreactor metagenome TaxID=1076179 RepID=A0A645HKB3_9ZZZZ